MKTPLTTESYDAFVQQRAIDGGAKDGILPPMVYYALALPGEAGEVAEKVATIFEPYPLQEDVRLCMELLAAAGRVGDKLKKVYRDNKGVASEKNHTDLIGAIIRVQRLATSLLGEILDPDRDIDLDRHHTPRLDVDERDSILKELGDTAFYLSGMANEVQATFMDVLGNNVHKLESRTARGTLQGSGDNR